jgi:hypothetical protein
MSADRPVAAFTALELLIATFIFMLVMGVTLALFFGSSREYEEVRGDLETNERASKAFDRLGWDVRQASLVERPDMVPVDRAPPAFEHNSPLDSTGTLALITEQPLVSALGAGLDATRRHVVYYLDRPRTLGTSTADRPVVTYTLFVREIAGGVESPPAPIVDGVAELVFYRTIRDPASAGGTGTGPNVVHVVLRAINPRERSDRKMAAGYSVELATCFALRGKDIATRRAAARPAAAPQPGAPAR